MSDLSVELQSQGKPVAEVQVTNMKAGVTRRPYNTNLAMSVHSLLLVDALQTFGSVYELLVASQKHVTVDNVKVQQESRSRTESFMFKLWLGAIYLRDHYTFSLPLFISQQSSEDAPLYPRSSEQIYRVC